MKWMLIGALLAFPLWGEETCQKNDADLFRKNAPIYSANVEFLYWSVAEGALDYALKMSHDAWGPTPSFAQGSFENATYGLDPGFRLSLLYFRAPHYWEMKWQYTRMTSRGDNESSKPDGDQQFLTGTWPQITTEPLAGAKSHIHLNYNVFDWVVSRVFFPNPHLRLRMIGGTLVAWMDQDWKICYFDAVPRSTTIRNRWSFIGAGLKTASCADWYWTGDLYMTAHGSLSLLIGSYSNHAKQTTTFQPTALDNPSVPVRDTSYHDVRPALTAQMMLGPSWQKNYAHSRFELFAGFEMNAWLNLQEIYRSTSSTSWGAKETWMSTSVLALYGLTTRLTYDF